MSAPAGVPLKRRATAPARSTDWMDQAACVGETAVDFVSDNADDQRDAVRFCREAQCPVRYACREYAKARRLCGVWGGELLGVGARSAAS